MCPDAAFAATPQVDSKKELEKLLKATCEAFIMAVTKLTVEPMLSFITKVTAVRVAASAQNSGAIKPLREQVSRQAYIKAPKTLCVGACSNGGCMLLCNDWHACSEGVCFCGLSAGFTQ